MTAQEPQQTRTDTFPAPHPRTPMRHAVLIVAILGSLLPGGLGLLWLSQQSREKETLKTNRETINKDLQQLPLAEVLDPSVRPKVQKNVDDYNSQQDIIYRRGR